MKKLGFLRVSATMRPEIRSLALYPDELRARPRFSAVSGRFRHLARQWLNGTGRQRSAHCGTLSSQCQTQFIGPMQRANAVTGPIKNELEVRYE